MRLTRILANNVYNIKPESAEYKQTRDNMNNTSNVTNTHNGHGFVDLGLPSGTLWATCNVGATSPEQAGLYFAFGETTGFTAEQVESGERVFDEKSYKAKDMSTNLTLEQDAAHFYMGGMWRMPTKAEFEELFSNTTQTWTLDYNGTGVVGHIFTSKVNGNSVFLPAAGFCDGSYVGGVGSRDYYWSASWYSYYYAWYLGFGSGLQGVYYCCRYYGYSVRGVCKKEPSKEKVDQVKNISRVIDVLTEVAKEYSGKTIENIIVQMKSRVVELKK